MEAGKLNKDFRDLLDEFLTAKVEFLLVGAFALALHGYPRATGDMDILVRPSSENARKLWKALRSFGAPLESAGITQDDFMTPDMVYQIGLPPRRIDILTEVTGLTFAEAWESRKEASIDGRSIPFLGRSALIKNKRATGRIQDLADVERLESQEE